MMKIKKLIETDCVRTEYGKNVALDRTKSSSNDILCEEPRKFKFAF